MPKTLAEVLALYRPPELEHRTPPPNQTTQDGPTASPGQTAPNDSAHINGAHISERMLACLVGLPRICAVRACRRHKRCFGPNAICLHHHSGLVDQRIAQQEQLEKEAAAAKQP